MSDWCGLFGMWVNDIEDNTDMKLDEICPEQGDCNNCDYKETIK